MQTLKVKKSAPTVLNAANEIAVEAFLNKKIPFLSISKIVDLTLNKSNICEMNNIEDVLNIDKESRKISESMIEKLV